jgi:hypothetical protein
MLPHHAAGFRNRKRKNKSRNIFFQIDFIYSYSLCWTKNVTIFLTRIKAHFLPVPSFHSHAHIFIFPQCYDMNGKE